MMEWMAPERHLGARMVVGETRRTGACERARKRDGTVGRSDAIESSLALHWDSDPVPVMRPRCVEPIRASGLPGLHQTGRTHDCKRHLHRALHDLLHARPSTHEAASCPRAAGQCGNAAAARCNSSRRADQNLSAWYSLPFAGWARHSSVRAAIATVGLGRGAQPADRLCASRQHRCRPFSRNGSGAGRPRGRDNLRRRAGDVLKSAVAATKTKPIVMQANDYDPLALGYVASLARPGGNVTGVFVQQIELIPKRLQLLTQMVPDLVRVVALWDRLSTDQFEAARSVAQGLKITLDGIECTDPPYDYESMLAGVDGRRRDVLLQMTSPLFFQDRQRLPAVALAHRLPSMFAFRQWVDAGGLMSYGASLSDMGRLIADYVDRIAKGAKPADLPVQQPAKFEQVINLKTANALGQTIPPSTLARADAIIE